MNARYPTFATAVLLSFAVATAARAADGPRVFAADPAEMVRLKQRVAANDPALRPAYELLVRDADRALKLKPASVMDKDKVAASGDKHDYLSFGVYFWPNPATKDGLPYVQRDGHRNTEMINSGDSPALEHMLSAVNVLGLAYYLSGREPYAEHAALLIRTFFLDPATRMNPNFTHAQAILGKSDGRGTGLIDFRAIYELVDTLGFIEGSKAWTPNDQKAMRQWMTEYWQWLHTHKNAKQEKAAPNNHGAWFDVHETAAALYLGKEAEAKEIAEQFKKLRIDAQVRPDGEMPRETARADGWSYSLFNLHAMTVMACLAQRVGVDLWQHQGPEGQGIRKAIDYVVPYLDPAKKWPFSQLKELSTRELVVSLLFAERAYGPGTYKQALERIGETEVSRNRAMLGCP